MFERLEDKTLLCSILNESVHFDLLNNVFPILETDCEVETIHWQDITAFSAVAIPGSEFQYQLGEGLDTRYLTLGEPGTMGDFGSVDATFVDTSSDSVPATYTSGVPEDFVVKLSPQLFVEGRTYSLEARFVSRDIHHHLRIDQSGGIYPYKAWIDGEPMRHANISTTMAYYVGANAEATAEQLWSNHGLEKETESGTHLGTHAEFDKLSTTPRKRVSR